MKKIFINLPVREGESSLKYYTHLGFTINRLFYYQNQNCMVWSEEVYVMLMSHEQFKKISRKYITDIKYSITAYFTLPVESPDRVNEVACNGLKAGGTEQIPMIFMQMRRTEDLDGHGWDIIYPDECKFSKE